MNISTADKIFELHDLAEYFDVSFQDIKDEFYKLLIDNKPEEAEVFLHNKHNELVNMNFGYGV